MANVHWLRAGSVGLIAVMIGAFAGCGGSDSSGSGSDSLGDGSAGFAGSGNGAGGATGTGSGGLGGQTLQGLDSGTVTSVCGTAGCICSNGIDDDNDGLTDGFDPECTGPLDNDEGSFATGIPGDNIDPKWQDCFFDGNSGAGDDGCRYSTDCLTGDLPQSSPDCTVNQQCLDYCKRLTPNGCDCFGCCTISTDQGDVNVTVGSTCSLEKIGDPKACPPCVKSVQCGNLCGTCELCPGKTEADLPASCGGSADAGPTPDGAPPPPAYTCDNGEAVCSATIPCPTDGEYYCQLGCCVPIIR